jgi:phosphatidylinositol glycan class O
LIGHFLSIDHIGHATSSITSPKIASKLTQISTFLKHLVNIMENDTMIIITGDHGMRSDGNHGGSSKE